MLTTIVKQPADAGVRCLIAFDSPVTDIVSVTVSARGLVAGASQLVADGAAPGPGGASIAVSGGADGERYLVTVVATLADGSEREGEIEVAVVDGAWTMPDGGAPWLSIDAFVRKFGLPEVVAMTDATGAGRIDRDLLVEALVDAQAQAEAEVAGRYALPLATVPRIVQSAIADIARAKLYPRGAPEGVADAAKAATRTLERIGAGTLQLGLPAVEAAAPAATETPVLISPGRRQYPDGLVDF